MTRLALLPVLTAACAVSLHGAEPEKARPGDDVASAVIAAEVSAEGQPDEAPAPLGELREIFDGEALDTETWLITQKNDFSELVVEIVDAAGDVEEGRLRLRCATIGTDDRTVKFLGVASRASLDLSGKKTLSVDFDWNDQQNGCYLTGAIYLCPTLTEGNPADEPQWLRLEYVGVPPGKNARAAIWLRDAQRLQWLYDEGWPEEQRTGRPVGKVHVEIRLEDRGWAVLEDGEMLFESGQDYELPFEGAHLYLQMSSHSNYPAREIFFDNFEFGPIATDDAQD